MKRTTWRDCALLLSALLLAAGSAQANDRPRLLAGLLAGPTPTLAPIAAASDTATGGDSMRDPGPPLTSDPADLDAALQCTPFEHPDRPPVLLVHGTTVSGTTQFTVFYAPQLVARGHDVCIVTYPDRGLIDMQTSAEYIVHALRTMQDRSGRRVAMIGHSQGAAMPRWALKFWPSAREAVEDFVMIAPPNHGTRVSAPFRLLGGVSRGLGLGRLGLGLVPEAFYQFLPESDFVAALNAGDETPGEIDYTVIYTLYDELVRPVFPVPTAALEFEQGNPRVSNLLQQKICPAHLSEHFTIGTSDPLAYALAIDAIDHPGPADPDRAGGSDLCSLLPLRLADILQPANIGGLLVIASEILREPRLRLHLAASEPPLRDYARAPIEDG